MKTIPLGFDVLCSDGKAGKSVRVVVDPETLQMTHLVVKGRKRPHTEWLVSVEQVEEVAADQIRLACTLGELAEMKVFLVTEYRQVVIPRYEGTEMSAQMKRPEVMTLSVEREHVPPGLVAVAQGAPVEATDGPVGQMVELVSDSDTGEITHLVLREKNLWGTKDVVLPVSAVKTVDKGSIYLTLDTETISAMLAIPTRWGATDVELVVFTAEKPEIADQVVKALKSVKEDDLKIVNLAELKKEQDGKTSIVETEDVDRKRGALFGAITGGLVGLLGGPVGVVVGAAAGAATGSAAANWIDMGFSDEYLQKLQESLQPGSSAVVILVEQESAGKLAETLGGFEGQAFRQALTDEMASQLTGDDE